MPYLAVTSMISGALIAAASEWRNAIRGSGALIASLPLVGAWLVWLWRDKPDAENMAAHPGATFWYIIPSLPEASLPAPPCLRAGRRLAPQPDSRCRFPAPARLV